jgi:hypothetical protein
LSAPGGWNRRHAPAELGRKKPGMPLVTVAQ